MRLPNTTALVLFALIGCGGTAESGFGETDGGLNFGDSGADSGAVEFPDGGTTDPVDAGPPVVSEVFGHSSNTLYRVNPTTKSVTIVGTLSGCEEVIDLALDKDSKMLAVSGNSLYSVNKTTAACTKIGSGSFPNSLSFVPAGILDPTKEALVGYVGSDYKQFDPATGAVISSKPGALPLGLASSGDIVSIINGPTYLTVGGIYQGTVCADCIIEVDPKTGGMKKFWGPIGYKSVWGVAFWAGAVYGFDSSGNLFQLDFPTSPTGTLQTKKITVQNAPTGLSFYGAGSTTAAPVTPDR